MVTVCPVTTTEAKGHRTKVRTRCYRKELVDLSKIFNGGKVYQPWGTYLKYSGSCEGRRRSSLVE